MNGGYRILTLLAALSATPLFTACAYAQYPYGHQDRGVYAPAQSQPFDIGYREGWEHGRNDARDGRDFAYQHAREYQRADAGYNPRFGNRDAYRYEFRRGYERGYREAYYPNAGGYGRNGNGGYYGNNPPSSYGRYGGPGYGYRSPAAEYGYNEGLKKGREDAEDHRAYDPLRQKWYREGDRHYDSRYGPRDAWANEYRQAFREGYDRGYRERRY